ncbi:cysteine protease ATG4D-like [Etheostoma cragini]|uniref:cysteine protease ATG4D-like n=1 Tax=Etheostoma cragini TaxID=417921 RepID=UPI00155E5EBB|nr:cysteine protease ATG4D-like [Etheostoma cragini]
MNPDASPTDDLMDDWLFLSSDSANPPGPAVSRQDLETEDRGQLKSKFISAWNSVKYGWSLKQKSKFSKRSPVIMLGQSYELKDHEERERFRRSFASLLWLTYRRGFPQLAGCSLTSDSGWGCVLRTGQTLLARGLLLHLMPPGWTWSASHHDHHAVKDDMDVPSDGAERGADVKEGPKKRGRKLSLGSLLDRPMEATHRRVVSWFADHPTAPFGIHQLVELGKSSGKKAGDWYGPSMAAHILRKAVAASADLPNLVVYVAQDCTIYLEDVKGLCERPPPQPWRSVIILVPVRLGGQDLNPSYIPCVKKLLTLQSCVGIIGGKPKHSLFFVGFQEDHLLYLDPHYCRPAVDITKENFPLESFHCKYPRKMAFSRMDPSCTIGFYAKGQKEFEALCTAVTEALSTSAETYPMFIFAEGKRQVEEPADAATNNTAYIQRKTARRRVDTCSSMDEFVLL